MGLDIYAGPVTRYVAGDWTTIVQQAGAASGVPIQVIRAGGPTDAIRDPAIIGQVVRDWQVGLVRSLGADTVWEDDPTTPWLTDKPDWDGYGAVVLLAAFEERPDLAPGQPARRGWRRRVVEPVLPRSFPDSDAFRVASQSPTTFPTLLRGAEWCLPLTNGPEVFTAATPNGVELTMGRVDRLVAELINLNERTLQLSPAELTAAREVGPPGPGATVSEVAPFGLSVMLALAEFAAVHAVPWIMDY